VRHRLLLAPCPTPSAPTFFLALGALAFALVPRAPGIAYGLVLLAFVWELFGSLLSGAFQSSVCLTTLCVVNHTLGVRIGSLDPAAMISWQLPGQKP